MLGHRIVWGSPGDSETWAELDSLLKTRWKHPLGGEIGVEAVAVDSGDGETMEDVYRFCLPRINRKIVPIKGDGGRRPWIEKTKSKAANGWLFIVGTDGLKSHLHSRLTRGHTVRFSKDLPEVWFEQLAGERAVLRRVGGQSVRKWEPVFGRRNEALDCTIYAFAVRELININWSARAEELRRPDLVAQAAPRQRVVPNPYMELR